MSVMRSPRKPLTKIVEFEELHLSLNAIRIHPELLQTRAETDKGYARAYAKAMAAGSKFPPVIAYRIDDEFWLVDGFTRTEAAMSLGLPTIRAVIRNGTMEDALLAGIEANFDQYHSRSVTPADRFHAVELLLRNESFRAWPDTQIGIQCGLSSATVRRIRLRLSEEEQVPIPDRVLRFRDGKPNGITTPYRVRRSAAGARVYRSTRKSGTEAFKTWIDGKLRYIGKDGADAAAITEQLNSSRAITRGSLSGRSGFVQWADRSAVLVDRLGKSECPTGGLIVRGVAAEPMGEVTVDGFMATCARLIFCREARPGLARMVVVGYVFGENSTVTLAAMYARQKFGIEVMTPEEFLAEFGPKDGEGASVASPEPSPQLTGAAS